MSETPRSNPPTHEEIINHAVGLLVTENIPKLVVPANLEGHGEVHVVCAQFPEPADSNEDTVYVMPLAILMDEDLRIKLSLVDDIETEGGEIKYGAGN